MLILDLKKDENKELTEKQLREVIEAIEKALGEGKKAKDLAPELFNVSISTLRNTLKPLGLVIDSKKKAVIKESREKAKVSYDAEYIAELFQDTQLSFRADGEMLEEFKNTMQEQFPSIPIAKLYNLALKEFLERVQAEAEKNKN